MGTVAKFPKDIRVPIQKIDDEQRLVYGIVLEPDTVDTQGDTVSEPEIEKAAHNYMLKSRVIGLEHKRKAEIIPVESYIAPGDFMMNNQTVRKGSWVLVLKVLDEQAWDGVKSGKYTGLSIGAHAIREDAG